jgi:hypothetical protein
MSPHWRLADHTEVDPRRHRRPSRLAIGSRVAHDLRYHCAKANRVLTDSSSRRHNSGSKEVADRDPDTIKRDIDQARDQLASTVDSLAERANPRRVAGDVKAAVARFVKKPAVAVSLAGVGALMLALLVRRIRRR